MNILIEKNYSFILYSRDGFIDDKLIQDQMCQIGYLD